jgi:membrane-bound serine protease (ClpP class)
MELCRAVLGRLVAGLGVLLVLLLPGAAPAGAAGQGPGELRVLVTRVATAITPVVADHIAAGLEKARSQGFGAYVIELDTPGGLVTSMREIVEDVLASPVPVLVYVSPPGARAASAGAIITFAAHVAVMAPGTSIGAATPVALDGGEIPAKVINDAAAQAEALARLRDRDVRFAADTVRKGRSAAVDEALRLGVVDAQASSLTAALEAADGRIVTAAADEQVTVRTAGAVVVRHDLGLFRRILQALADPNVAFLLLTLGTLGLIYELATPGIGVAGVTGAIALLLALFSLSVLPVNVVGLLLLAAAAALFVAELFAPGVAGFAFGGAVVLVLAAVFLFDDSEGVAVDPAAFLPTAVVAAGATLLAGRLVMRTRKVPSTSTGADVFPGRIVTVREADGLSGRTFTEGAWWSLRSAGPPLRPGTQARVVALDGLVMLVDPIASNSGSDGESREQERGDP